jgi:hypothetical protein
LCKFEPKFLTNTIEIEGFEKSKNRLLIVRERCGFYQKFLFTLIFNPFEVLTLKVEGQGHLF